MAEPQFRWDVAISYAAADRARAREIALLLRPVARVFFDEFEESYLWGTYGTESLDAVFGRLSRFTLVLVSREYLNRVWTRFELRAMRDRAMRDQSAYVLPVMLDDGVALPGLSGDLLYLDWRKKGAAGVAQAVLAKLESPTAAPIGGPRSKRGLYAVIATTAFAAIAVAIAMTWPHAPPIVRPAVRPVTVPDGMALIPGDAIKLGTDEKEIEELIRTCTVQHVPHCDKHKRMLTAETPTRAMSVSAFLLDKTEVDNARFSDWLNTRTSFSIENGVIVKSGAPLFVLSKSQISNVETRFVARSGWEHFAVAGVTWYGALQYCRDHHKTLPTEAQWELAARGPERRTYPWGQHEPTCRDAIYGLGADGPCRAGSLGPEQMTNAGDRTPQSVVGLAGGVMEWVFDKYRDGYPDCGRCVDWIATGSEEEQPPLARSLRGGHWRSWPFELRGARRNYMAADQGSELVGFRCAAPAERKD